MGPILNGRNGEQAEWDDLHAALVLAEGKEADRFVIVERSGQQFMQTLCVNDGWILEKREGGPDQHFRALAPDIGKKVQTKDEVIEELLRTGSNARWLLSMDEIFEALHQYLLHNPDPEWLMWERYAV